ncbi:MAG: hypothetical protein ACE5G0_13945 [Rhodothermales bacterium]
MCGYLLSWLSAFTPAWWLSLGLGIGLGLLYSAASLVVNRYALRQDSHRFLLIVLGGMIARMALALALVALIVLLLPVEQVAFLASFLGVFVIGIIVEVMILHRKLLAANNT